MFYPGFLISICLLSLGSLDVSGVSIPYLPSATTCDFTNHEYFSLASLSCKQCFDSDRSTITFDSELENTDLLSGEYLQFFSECQCREGYIKQWDATEESYSCVSCSSNTAATRDQTRCLPCGTSTGGYDSDTSECICSANNEVLVEKNSLGAFLDAKECVSCPGSTTRGDDLYTCAECTSDTCPCDSGFSRDNQSGECVEETLLAAVQNAYTVNDLNIDFTQMRGSNTIATAESKYLRENFYKIAAQCRSTVNRRVLRFQECSALANLCVATLYDESSVPCQEYLDISSNIIGGENGWDGWKARLPFIFHGENPPQTSNSIPDATDLNYEVSLSRSSSNSRFDIRLSKYAFNGTWLGFEQLSTQLSNCDDSDLAGSEYLYFGTNQERRCNLNIFALQYDEEPLFYEPFIVYETGGNTLTYPLPIQILTGTDDSYVDPREGPLYRRFFRVENVLGKLVDSTTDNLRYIRFLASAQLRVVLRGDEQIYPPILTLRYESRDMEEISQPSTGALIRNTRDSDTVRFPEVGFSVSYTMSMQAFNLTVLITSLVFMIFAVFLSILQAVVFLRKREYAMLDMEIVFKFIGFITNNLANTIFVVVFVASMYLYWFFKYQNNALVLLPADLNLIPYYVYVSVGLVLKFVDVIITTYRQTHYDVFFVDWEKPKEMTDGSKKPPSVWRTLFVSKQWNKLSSQRLINLEVTLLIVLVLLEGAGFMYIATEQPNASNFDRDFSTNPPLRFAVTSMIWLSIVITVYIFTKYIYHRFVKSPLNTFIDVCSLSNISVIALAEQNFGYYIHGASVHEHADVNINYFDQALYREQEDAVLRRGMIPDANVQAQTFEMYVTHQFRLDFNEMLKMRIQTFKVRAKMHALPSQQNQGLNMNRPMDQRVRQNQSNQQPPNQAHQNQQNMNASQNQANTQVQNQQQPNTQQQNQTNQPQNQPNSPQNQTQAHQNQQNMNANSQSQNQHRNPQQQNQMDKSQNQPNSTQNQNQMGNALKQQMWNAATSREYSFQDSSIYKFINPNRRVNPTPELYDAYNELNDFLKEQINEIRSDYMKRIRSKDLFYRIGVPPQMTMIHKNVMYVDSAKSFSNLFLSGIEFKMLIFNIFLFAVCDLMKNSIVSFVIVYIINAVLLRLRKFWIRNTIINRNLFDERMI